MIFFQLYMIINEHLSVQNRSMRIDHDIPQTLNFLKLTPTLIFRLLFL